MRRSRPGKQGNAVDHQAAHVGALPGLEFLPLDFAGTSTPEAYDRTGVWAVDIGKP
ncbi:hypothetical protein [Streptomyces mirabilis]|uniref:hypothetical protein n=1 Tax=Streptomyces mirabilis TaxID=68239 RepID=UPI0036B1482B